MAFPSVETTSTSTEPALEVNHFIQLPSGIVSGNLLIAIFQMTTPRTVTWPSGWTQFFTLTGLASFGKIAIAYRQADGTEGTNIQVTTNLTTRSAHNAYRISSAANPASQVPEAAGVSQAGDFAPNPPSLTPTGGAKDYLWLAVAGIGGDDNILTPPTSYTNLIATNISVNGPSAGSARRQLNAASENPGTFTDDNGLTWIGVTVAIHPVAAPIVNTPKLQPIII